MPKEPKSQTLKEYGRGIAGGLIFSLPLLYTMEVWWRGFTAHPAAHLVLIIATYLVLIGYNYFSGIRKNATWKGVCWDSVEEFGMAFVLSFLFLLLIGKISFEMSLYEMGGKVIVESMVVAIGISVGTAQLGQQSGGSGGKDSKKERKPGAEMIHIFVLAVCGALLVSSSVAPTMEILRIGVEAEILSILLMVLLSLLLSFIIMFFIDFAKTGNREQGAYKMILHVMICYCAALATSFFLLWYFGRFEDRSLAVCLSQIIVLAVPGSLGASAGRLLITK